MNKMRLLISGVLIVLTTIINVLLCTYVSTNIMLYLISTGVEKNLSLLIAFAVAIFIYFYILFNYKARNFIKETGKRNE
jgi:hypothetical protein